MGALQRHYQCAAALRVNLFRINAPGCSKGWRDQSVAAPCVCAATHRGSVERLLAGADYAALIKSMLGISSIRCREYSC